MKYPRKLYEQAEAILQRRHQEALEIQDQRMTTLEAEHPAVAEVYRRRKRQAAQLGWALFREPDKAAALRAEHEAAHADLEEKLAMAGLAPDYLEPPFHCKECEDKGVRGGRHCKCKQAVLNQLVYEQLCDVSIVRDCSFDNFSLDYYEGEQREVMRKVLASCRNYVANFSKAQGSLLFTGATGLGKTHLSLAIAEGVARSGHLVMYASAPRLTGQLEQAKFQHDDEAEEYRTVIYGCDLLVVDDLGAEMVTRYTQAEIYDLVNTRINTGLPTIINTNLDMRALEKTYTDRVFSRLLGTYTLIQFKGRDIRLEKRLGRRHEQEG